MTNLLFKLNKFREEEMKKLLEFKYPYGNVTTINLTVLKGGVQFNVIPETMSATFDIRMSINTDLNEVEQMVLSIFFCLSDCIQKLISSFYSVQIVEEIL